MPSDDCVECSLFGGAISSIFPLRFQDVSNIRVVPDHQEVFVDLSRDESLIFELLDLKHDVEDNESARWFLQDLATEQDAQGNLANLPSFGKSLRCTWLSWSSLQINICDAAMEAIRSLPVLEDSGTANVVGLQYRDVCTVVTTAVGQMSISKERQGREAQNLVRVYLANIRLREVGTDVLITAYEPILINPLSASARTVGAGPTVPARETGCLPVADVFHVAVSNFKVHDWSLFGAGPHGNNPQQIRS